MSNRQVTFYKHKDRLYLRIKSEHKIIDKPVTEQDKQQFPHEWNLFESKDE